MIDWRREGLEGSVARDKGIGVQPRTMGLEVGRA